MSVALRVHHVVRCLQDVLILKSCFLHSAHCSTFSRLSSELTCRQPSTRFPGLSLITLWPQTLCSDWSSPSFPHAPWLSTPVLATPLTSHRLLPFLSDHAVLAVLRLALLYDASPEAFQPTVRLSLP